MRNCDCIDAHDRKRVVLTGGPSAGKTAVLELVRQHFCQHVLVLPQSAAILFRGGLARGTDARERCATERAIYHLQLEIESTIDAQREPALVVCDRGTVDCAAYWPGAGSFWPEVGTTLDAELRRYDFVVHMRSPRAAVYDRQNPLCTESAAEAALVDQRVAEAWAGHPRRVFVEGAEDFLDKAKRALALLGAELPRCCR